MAQSANELFLRAHLDNTRQTLLTWEKSRQSYETKIHEWSTSCTAEWKANKENKDNFDQRIEHWKTKIHDLTVQIDAGNSAIPQLEVAIRESVVASVGPSVAHVAAVSAYNKTFATLPPYPTDPPIREHPERKGFYPITEFNSTVCAE